MNRNTRIRRDPTAFPWSVNYYPRIRPDGLHNAVVEDDSKNDLDGNVYDEVELLTSPPPYDTELEFEHDPPVSRLGIRPEEIGIIVGIMLLWIGAIVLFFNRWGKIRSLEPYQPKFCEEHRPSCPISESSVPPLFPRSFSKLNLLTDENPHYAKFRVTGREAAIGGLAMRSFGIPTGVITCHTVPAKPIPPKSKPMRSRQNSLFSPYETRPSGFYKGNPADRKTKSDIDLPGLILSEEFFQNVRRNSKQNYITHL